MSSSTLVVPRNRAREETLDIRTILRGITCDHRRMRSTPCNECRKSGRFCQIVTCPDCGLSWDNSEGVHG